MHAPLRKWPRIWPRAIAVGFVLAAVATAAAQIAARHHEAPATDSAPAAEPRRHHHRGARRATTAQIGDAVGADAVVEPGGEPRSESEPGTAPMIDQGAPPVAAAVADPPPKVERTPDRTPDRTQHPPATTSRIRKGARHNAVSPDVSADRAPVPPDSSPPSSSGAWTAAAVALRAGDQAGAERALARLVETNEPHTRDAARLARAQIWLAQGRVNEARAELENLAATGATPLIRQRAREALDESR